jgi:hypothetical protein
MDPSRYRAGPWPGLTPRGASVLLAGAGLLAVGLALIGNPSQPLPDLVLQAMVSLTPLALASCIVRMPGVASAVCGAYLLPRSLLSLLLPVVPPPPLLLVPAIVFDVALWLRLADLTTVAGFWPWGRAQRRWRKRRRVIRQLTRGHVGAAGAVYGLVLCMVVPPWAVLLGGDPAAWPLDEMLVTAALAAAVSAAVGALALGLSSVRGTG